MQFTKRVLLGPRHFAAQLPPRHSAELVEQGDGGLNWGDGGAKSWLIVSHEALRPDGIHEEGREGIASSTVTVALPLAEEEWPRLMDGGVVFAYLPTETVPGFPFLLNANFVLAASRERLHDRKWNEWLLSCVPPLFCEAFMLLLQSLLNPSKDMKSIENRPRWESLYRLLRPPHEYSGSPLKQTGVAISEAMQRVRCVVAHDERLQKPCECRFASNEIISVVKHASTNTEPDCLQNRFIVHPNLREDTKCVALLRSLGAKSFDKTLLLQCVGDLKWVRAHANSPEWYVLLFRLCMTHNIRPNRLHLGIPLDGTGRFIQENETATLFLDTGENIPSSVLVPTLVLFFDKQIRALVAESPEMEAWLTSTMGFELLNRRNYAIRLAQHLQSEAALSLRQAEAVKYGRYVIGTLYDTTRRIGQAPRAEGVPEFPLYNQAGRLIPSWDMAVSPFLFRRYEALFKQDGVAEVKRAEFETFLASLKTRIIHNGYFENWSRTRDTHEQSDTAGLPEECAEGFCRDHCAHSGCPTPMLYEVEGSKQRPRAEAFPWMWLTHVFESVTRAHLERARLTLELVHRLKPSVNLDAFRAPAWFPTQLGSVPPPMVYYPGPDVRDEFGDGLPYSAFAREYSQEEHEDWSLGVCSGTTANHIAAYIENIAAGVPVPDKRCVQMVSPLLEKLHYLWTQTRRCPKFRSAFLPLVHDRHTKWITHTVEDVRYLGDTWAQSACRIPFEDLDAIGILDLSQCGFATPTGRFFTQVLEIGGALDAADLIRLLCWYKEHWGEASNVSHRQVCERVITIYRLLAQAPELKASQRALLNTKCLVLCGGNRWISCEEARWISYEDALHDLYSDLLSSNIAMPGGIAHGLDARGEPGLRDLLTPTLTLTLIGQIQTYFNSTNPNWRRTWASRPLCP